jgi:hypothetical protein
MQARAWFIFMFFAAYGDKQPPQACKARQAKKKQTNRRKPVTAYIRINQD